jgi:hypothetical protein
MSNSSIRFNSRIEQKFLFDESDRVLVIVRRSNSIREIVRNLRLVSNLIDWWKNELLTAVCFYLDKKITSLYKNSFSKISFTDLSSHDSSRSLWESRSSVVTRLISSDQDVFELCCHFDLISSESHTHFRTHWSLDDFENQ